MNARKLVQAIGAAAIAALGATLIALPAQAAGLKRATVTARATVLQSVSIGSSLDLSTGNVKTKGSNPTGTIIVPATYPMFATPAPTFPDTSLQNGAKAVDPNAARIDLTGSPGAAFTVNFLGWTQVFGTTGATAAASSNTYYSPTSSPTNQPRGVFDATGKASVYIGGTVVVARDPSGGIVRMKPNVTVTYN